LKSGSKRLNQSKPATSMSYVTIRPLYPSRQLALSVLCEERHADFDLRLFAEIPEEASRFFLTMERVLRPRHVLPECRVGTKVFRQVFVFEPTDLALLSHQPGLGKPALIRLESNQKAISIPSGAVRFRTNREVREFVLELRKALNAAHVAYQEKERHVQFTAYLDYMPQA
jgi:hypothetical protein